MLFTFAWDRNRGFLMIITRKKIESVVEKRISGFLKGYTHNIALIGQPKSGKSVLLSNLLSKKYAHTDLLPIYINLFFVDATNFTKASFYSLLYNYLSGKDYHNPAASLDELIYAADSFMPKTIALIKKILATGGTSRENVKHVFDVIEVLIQECNIKPLVIIDEFYLFKKFPKKQLTEMTKRIMINNSCMFLFIASDKVSADAVLNNDLNILFGKFEKIYIEEFTSKESHYFLDTRLRQQVPKECCEFLLEITGRNPFVLDLLCESFNRLPVDTLSEDLFIHTLAAELTCVSSPAYQYCYNYITQLKNDAKTDRLTNVLMLIADGYTRRKEIASFMKLETSKLTSKLSVLLDKNILSKVGSFYFLQNVFLSNWIAIVLKPMTYNGFLFPNDLSFHVEKHLMKRYQLFKNTINKSKFDRIIELINNFNDDTVCLNSKTLKLPHIDKFRVIPARSEGLTFVIGEAKKTYVILGFKEGQATEQDVAEFGNRCSYFKSKQPKKIFIALDEIDSNTKLLAKQKKLTYWNRKNLNLLMHLYNQPALV